MDLDHFTSPFSGPAPDDRDKGPALLSITVDHVLDPRSSDQEHLSQFQGGEIPSEEDESTGRIVLRVEDSADRPLIAPNRPIMGKPDIPSPAGELNPLEIAHIWRVWVGFAVRDQ